MAKSQRAFLTEKSGAWATVRYSLRLLSPRDRRLLGLAVVLQTALGFLDLIGIALIGVLAIVAVAGLENEALPGIVATLLDITGLSNLSVGTLTLVLGVSAAAMLLLKSLLSLWVNRRILFFLAKRRAQITTNLTRELLSLPYTEILKWSSQRSFFALVSGVAAITHVLAAFGRITSEAFLVTTVVILVIVTDPLLMLPVVALFAGALVMLQVSIGRRTAASGRAGTAANVNSMVIVQGVLGTFRESTVLGRKAYFLDEVRMRASEEGDSVATQMYFAEMPKYVLEALLVVGAFGVAGVQLATRDMAAAAGSLALLLAAGMRALPALLRLQGAVLSVRAQGSRAFPTYELKMRLDKANSGRSVDDAPPLSAVRKFDLDMNYDGFRPDLQFQSVTFRYPGASEPATEHVTFGARAGETLALAGSTGAGKSTVADLILGVLEPSEGSILVSGMSPHEAVTRWPGAIAYVPQDVVLIEGSVRQNVAIGLPDDLIDDERVMDALRRAHLADFLLTTREGLDTLVGERGVRLSGGQRQRLGIARALYSQPRLLVLDEATSALDSETEHLIVETLAELRHEVTVVVVAHRLATIRDADQVVYLEQGKVVGVGTFDEVRALAPRLSRQAELLGL